ncbi:hypothetical protein KFZ56_17180 [Virgibacillus sp. NKC19-3]|uniref:hypothetical protein n=1 Tax=Virgibacillus saliphilus TaxID=2831674 RepID=UPI001C9B6EB2|nr:hypothetical protein [Virgibacillus sp. NKC19-3]MBY7144755.1 hypothetical protein [Virgibacillus sp. NKC19-3]
MEIELNYIKNEEDIQKFAENYYEFSLHAKKNRNVSIFIAIFFSLVGALLLYSVFKEDGPLTYLAALVLLLIITIPISIKGNKDQYIKEIKKQLVSYDIGSLGKHKAILSDNEVHVSYLPNNQKKERNMTNKWDDFDFYNRDGDHFFLYINKSDLIYHIKAGEKADTIDDLLREKRLSKQEKNKK